MDLTGIEPMTSSMPWNGKRVVDGKGVISRKSAKPA